MIEAAGFIIAVGVGLTGMGAGSLALPFLVLFAGLPAAVAVVTSLAFSAALRLLAAPFLRPRRLARTLWPMLAGGLPGLALGCAALRRWSGAGARHELLLAIGLLLVVAAAASLRPEAALPTTAPPPRVGGLGLAALALPIGLETGLSSAGSGSFGVLVLIGVARLHPADAVAVDLVFSGVLALAGATAQAGWAGLPLPLLTRLLIGGLPGVLFGLAMARRLPARWLRRGISVLALASGLVLVARAGCAILAR